MLLLDKKILVIFTLDTSLLFYMLKTTYLHILLTINSFSLLVQLYYQTSKTKEIEYDKLLWEKNILDYFYPRY